MVVTKEQSRKKMSTCRKDTRATWISLSSVLDVLYILRPFWIVQHHLLLQPSSPCHCGHDISTFFNGSATSTTIITYCRVRGVNALYSRPFCERALVLERANHVDYQEFHSPSENDRNFHPRSENDCNPYPSTPARWSYLFPTRNLQRFQ